MTTGDIEIGCAIPLPDGLDLDALETLSRGVLSDRGADGSVTLVLADDETLHKLNREFRGTDAPTDVLSFDMQDPVHPSDDALGEVYISIERARVQAEEDGRPFQDEMAHLAIHGILHLLGFDHQTEADGNRMRHQERRYLAQATQVVHSKGA